MIHELHLTPGRSEHLATGEACSESFSRNLDCQWQHRKENGRQPLKRIYWKGNFHSSHTFHDQTPLVQWHDPCPQIKMLNLVGLGTSYPTI